MIVETQGLTKKKVRSLRGGRRPGSAHTGGSVFALIGPNGAGKTNPVIRLLDEHPCGPTTGRPPSARRRTASIPATSNASGMCRKPEAAEALYSSRITSNTCGSLYPAWDRGTGTQLSAAIRAATHSKRSGDLFHGMRMKALLVDALAYRQTTGAGRNLLSGLDTLVRDEVVNGLGSELAKPPS